MITSESNNVLLNLETRVVMVFSPAVSVIVSINQSINQISMTSVISVNNCLTHFTHKFMMLTVL